MPDIRVCQVTSVRLGARAANRSFFCPPQAHPRPPSVAISVGTTPMIAIPVAAFMGSLAMIVGPAPQTCCNHFGHGRPMIAIPTADDCGSLHILAAPVADRLVPVA